MVCDDRYYCRPFRLTWAERNVIESIIQPDLACFGPCMKFSIHQVKNT
jgi:hypothetical protein